MHATGMLQKCFLHVCMLQRAAYMRLHTCKLLVFLICAAYIHAHYYSAAYMLPHMQATSVPICAAYIHAHYYSAAYMLPHMQATSVPICAAYIHACYSMLHTCCLHTCKLLVFLICAACIHACYYSAAYTLHILGMYTAYLRHIQCITCNTIGVHLTVCR